MNTLDEQIMKGEAPEDPGVEGIPAIGTSYYGDARRAGLDHETACRRAYREMAEAARSITPVLEQQR